MGPTRLEVVALQGASDLPVWAAQERGFFARHGLEVALSITSNSVELARDLHSGCRQIALPAVDNVVTYVEGQGEAGLSLVAAPDVATIAGAAQPRVARRGCADHRLCLRVEGDAAPRRLRPSLRVRRRPWRAASAASPAPRR